MTRILKLGLISGIFFFLLITGFSLFIPPHIRISRAINIGSSSDSILNNIAGIEKWKYWYPGFDTLALQELEKKDGKLLSVKTKGISIVLSELKESRVVAEFRSGRKKPVIQRWETISHPGTDSVTLQWGMDFRLCWYPWEKFSSLMFEKRYGAQMEQGLTNLKTILEN